MAQAAVPMSVIEQLVELEVEAATASRYGDRDGAGTLRGRAIAG